MSVEHQLCARHTSQHLSNISYSKLLNVGDVVITTVQVGGVLHKVVRWPGKDTSQPLEESSFERKQADSQGRLITVGSDRLANQSGDSKCAIALAAPPHS